MPQIIYITAEKYYEEYFAWEIQKYSQCMTIFNMCIF